MRTLCYENYFGSARNSVSGAKESRGPLNVLRGPTNQEPEPKRNEHGSYFSKEGDPGYDYFGLEHLGSDQDPLKVPSN